MTTKQDHIHQPEADSSSALRNVTPTCGRPLTDRQQKFVEAYTLSGIGEQAAIQAGYSRRRAKVTASELLRHPSVAAEIRRRGEARMVKHEISAERLDQILNSIAENAQAKDADRIAAVQQLNRVMGRYVERLEVNDAIHVARVVRGFSKSEQSQGEAPPELKLTA